MNSFTEKMIFLKNKRRFFEAKMILKRNFKKKRNFLKKKDIFFKEKMIFLRNKRKFFAEKMIFLKKDYLPFCQTKRTHFFVFFFSEKRKSIVFRVFIYFFFARQKLISSMKNKFCFPSNQKERKTLTNEILRKFLFANFAPETFRAIRQ